MWTAATLEAEGSVEYFYADENEDVTYSFNTISYSILGGEPVELNLCFVYAGVLTREELDSANPIKFYAWMPTLDDKSQVTSVVLIYCAQMKMFPVNAKGEIEVPSIEDIEIAYIINVDNEGTTYVFAEGGTIYVFIGTYTEEQVSNGEAGIPTMVLPMEWTLIGDQIMVDGDAIATVNQDGSITMNPEP